MKPVDIFLQEIIKNNFFQDSVDWKTKDKKILESLGHQLKNNVFFTENQGNLLVKILSSYQLDLEKSYGLSLDFLKDPTWSKEFRSIDVIKRIYISNTSTPEILLEFSYNKRFKDKLFSMSKLIEGDIYNQKNNIYSVPLTEKNVYELVENFKEFNFDFDGKITNFYNEIRKIKADNNISFSLHSIENKNLMKKLVEDIGTDNLDNKILLHDRKLKFQYKLDDILEENTLTNKIAVRNETDIFVNSEIYSFQSLVKALIEIKRLPTLVIFDSYDEKLCTELLNTIHQSFLDTDLEDKVGIYFRLENSTGKEFNSRIAELGYNHYLDSSVNLVGLSNKQLPKFILKNKWKPKSVICFGPSFKNSKIYSYCDTVDLKICYTKSKPVTGFDYAVM